MPNDKFEEFLKNNSDAAPKKHQTEYSQILNKIEASAPAWKDYISFWPAAAVAFIFVGFISLSSLQQASTSAEELASLESYIEAEFYGVSLEEDEDYY